MSRIDEQALDWVVRQASGPLDEALQQAFNDWYDRGPREQGAYLRAQALWQRLDQAAMDTDRTPPMVLPVAEKRSGWRPDRRLVMGGAIAACAVAAFVGWHAFQTPVPTLVLETGLGEISNHPLEDRSLVSLNSDSRIEVRMTPERRQVNLVKGEALFQVAKNPQRPFVVTAGSVSVRAVGTAFSVRLRGEGAEVLVTEGVVEVTENGTSTRLRAGEAGRIAQNAVSVRSDPSEVSRKLAWREGRIVLANQSLAEAAEEFNRYNRTRIYIADPALSSRKLVGQYGLSQPEKFAENVHELMGVPVTVSADRIDIGRRPD
ncbi:FecR domain-containing protein [Asticcacaulis sp.]|uniref:FecR family protein n=1 Tax=Asticcacaulis sp. TaxID=1872648 RepID=UPI002634E483|nr:FecR domain-containing protein [Asticcacaulis sp.]